jgi:hypothetical protein
VLRDLPVSRKLELMNAFLEAYGATKTRGQVDVFLRALLRANHEESAVPGDQDGPS